MAESYLGEYKFKFCGYLKEIYLYNECFLACLITVPLIILTKY